MDLEVLRKAPLFTNLDDEVFAILTSELTEVELSRGASAFHEGDQGDQLYVIMSGKIKLGRTASDGRENLVAVLGPGEIFGEMALFNPAPRNATATAVSATRLAGLRHENLRRAIGSSPDVSVQLLQALAQLLGFQRVLQAHAAEQFRGEVRDAGEAQHFAFGEGVADLDGAVVVQTNNIARPCFFQMLTVTRQEGQCITNTYIFTQTHMLHFQAFFILT